MTSKSRSNNETEPSRRDKPPVKEREQPDQPSHPPDSIPDILPGVDPQQTPGIDRPPAQRHEGGRSGRAD